MKDMAIMKKSIDSVARNIAKQINETVLSAGDIEEIIDSDVDITKYFRTDTESKEAENARKIIAAVVIQYYYKILIKRYEKFGFK